MIEERERGMALRRPYLSDRQTTPYADVAHLSRSQALVKLVDLDTAKPGGTIYEEVLDDPLNGIQKMRVLNTTKPYNPDFIHSAQTLTFLLPENPSQAIITPLDGTWETWHRFLRTNRIAAEAMIDLYTAYGMKDFEVFTGIGFGPYSDQDYLKSQSIKAAHLHSYLVSQELLRESSPFTTRSDLRDIHRQGGTPAAEISKDLRRFFPGGLYEGYSHAAILAMMNSLDARTYEALGTATPIPTQFDGRFPTSGIAFSTTGLEVLESEDFFDAMKTSYAALEDFYRQILMPIFTTNYEDVISEEYPIPKKLQFNDSDTALHIFDETMRLPLFAPVPVEQISKWKTLTGRLAKRLHQDKPEGFSLGPGYSITARYFSGRNDLDIFIISNPFGGGAVEGMGVNKIPITSEEQGQLFQRFYSAESVRRAKELEEAIRSRLTQLA